MPGRVIALMGLPGSGKTTLAAYLVQRHALTLIDRDAIRSEMFPECAFTQAEKQAANQAVLERLREHCAAGRSSLLDGMTFGRKSEREAVQAIAAERGLRFIGLWLDCPVDVAMARVATQTHGAADRSPDLVRQVADRFEKPEDAVRIDATLAPKEICQRAEASLG